jgi:hypothetical protein
MYAGVDFSRDLQTYDYLGTEGGYVDGEVNEAQFTYPISLALSSEEDNIGIASGVLYVADRSNNAVRRVGNLVTTPAPSSSFAPTIRPTVSPKPSHIPSPRPSSNRPTVSMLPTVSEHPTPRPSHLPSLSSEPTFNPTKRPTRHPTPRPTRKPTPLPTKATIIVQDVSLFHSMGLGTFHVTTGALVGSLFVGLLIGGFIVSAYLYRTTASHRRLRTSDLTDFPPFDSGRPPPPDPHMSLSSRARSLLSHVYSRAVSLVHQEDETEIGGGLELSVDRLSDNSNSDSSHSMRQMLQSIRHQSLPSAPLTAQGSTSGAHGSGAGTDRSGYLSYQRSEDSLAGTTSALRVRSIVDSGDGL